jgi:hypothetical protein
MRHAYKGQAINIAFATILVALRNRNIALFKPQIICLGCAFWARIKQNTIIDGFQVWYNSLQKNGYWQQMAANFMVGNFG